MAWQISLWYNTKKLTAFKNCRHIVKISSMFPWHPYKEQSIHLLADLHQANQFFLCTCQRRDTKKWRKILLFYCAGASGIEKPRKLSIRLRPLERKASTEETMTELAL